MLMGREGLGLLETEVAPGKEGYVTPQSVGWMALKGKERI